jgi:hypothetical protein
MPSRLTSSVPVSTIDILSLLDPEGTAGYPLVRYITSPMYRADPGCRKRKRTLCRIRQTPFVNLMSC